MGDSTPGIVVGFALGATLVTIVLTPLLSLLVLGAYRRSVGRSMRASAPGIGPVPPVLPVPPPRRPPTGHERPGPVTAFATAQVRGATLGCLVAGVVYAVTATCVLFVAGGQAFTPGRIAFVSLVLGWPLLPTLAVVVAPRRRWIAAAAAGYVVVLLLLGAYLGTGPGDVVYVWTTLALPGALLLLAVAARPLRAVGPFLAIPVFVLVAGLVLTPWLALPLVSVVPSAGGALLLALAVVLVATALASLNIPAAARRYRRKTSGDQSIAVDQWWLLGLLFPSLVLASARPWPGLALLVLPYLTYRLTVYGSRRMRGRRGAVHRPARLLVLRVFGSRTRSERLLRDLGAYWRYAGPIDLIAARDLATENLEPHEFLDFVRGRLSRRFVTGPADLARRIDERDVRPDADGRFRVNEFFCHDDTWRETVDRLLMVTDVVLIDLRGLTPQRRGVTYELRRLVELGLLGRVVALVDASTDEAFLRATTDAAGAGRALCTLRVQRGGRAGTLHALRQLETASWSATADRPGVRAPR